MKTDWKTAVQNWVPRYNYECPMIPFADAIRAANLTPEKIAFAASPAIWGLDKKWDHDAMQNVLTLPGEVSDALRAARERHEARENLRRWPTLYGAGDVNPLHRRISERTAGEFLRRQEKIDYALLYDAHHAPGVSMTDTLRAMSHPSARRLAAAA
jgi:hypothetical protein